MRRIIPVAILLLASSAASAQTLPEPDVRREEQAFENARGARYMEQNCADTTYAGWAGFPVRRCTYTVRESGRRTKTATVVLLDATPRQLARWVVQACAEVKHTTASACTGRLRRQIIEQSGAQFPVAGIVLEDMDGDGVQNLFVFRDGVTSRIAGIRNTSTEAITPEMTRRALADPVVSAATFGRIASTTREQYRANGGTVNVGVSGSGNTAWLGVVRTLYQQAFRGDRNELIVAWLKAN